MEALFQIIAAAIDFVVQQVNEALDADVKHRVFLKEGEIQNALVNNLQAQYSNLENALGQAALTQYQSNLQAETEAKVLKGNLTSIAVVIIVVMLIAAIFYLARKK